MDEFAVGCVAGLEDEFPIGQRLERAFLRIESQLSLAGFLVGAVADEAAVGQERLDVVVEIHAGGKLGGVGLRAQRGEREP